MHFVDIQEKGAIMHVRYAIAILSLSLAVVTLMPETAFGQRRGGSGGSGGSRGYGGYGGYYPSYYSAGYYPSYYSSGYYPSYYSSGYYSPTYSMPGSSVGTG